MTRAARARAASIAAAVVLLVPARGAAATAPPEAAELPRAGATGVVLTTLAGSEIVEIPLRYLGTLEDYIGPGHDLHLVQLEGPDAEHIGVAAGMSGSPVYVEGRLIGALSYRMGTLPKDPLAGVTPIAEMLDAQRAGSAGSAPAPPAGASRIALPMQARGLAAEVARWLEPQLAGTGLVLGAGAGGAPEPADTGAAPEMRPGAPLAVVLVRGAVTLAATGTVTWVDGDTVWAFGHPFFGDGRAELPMHRAEIVVTTADLLNPGKLSRLGAEVGAILDDRLTAVVGRIGARAAMIPLEVRVRGADYGEQRFHFEVVRRSSMTPLLVGAAVANALVGNAGFNREATLHVAGRIVLAGAPELSFAGDVAGASPEAHGLAVASRLVQTLAALRDNPFAEVAVERIELDVEARRDVRRYALEALVRDRGVVQLGTRLDVDCALREFRGATVTRRLTLDVPEGLSEGTRLILVAGSPEGLEAALGRSNQRRLQTAADLDTFVRVLGARGADARLAVELHRFAPGVVSRGAAYANLPPSAERLLAAGRTVPAATRTFVAPLARAAADLDGPVTGTLMFRLRVRNGRITEDSEG